MKRSCPVGQLLFIDWPTAACYFSGGVLRSGAQKA